jgi:uncharacterized repeat protein (TIGR01451 family)
MTKSYLHGNLIRRLTGFSLVLFSCLAAGLPAAAQNYLLRYVNTASGAVTFTGNTLGLAKQSGANQPGTLDSIGTFITLNTNSQVGNYAAGTTLNWSNDSSAAVLNLPTNSTVLYAELIWAGSAQIAADPPPAGNVLTNLNTPVKFFLPDGSTNLIAPDPVTATTVTNGSSAIFYVRSANVTALVQGAGAGTYAAGGVPGTAIASEDANNACGWTLAVVYGNPALHPRNLSLFVGNSFAISGGAAPNPAAVTGFCTPSTGTVNARLLVSAVEGDPNKTGDQMLFGPTTNTLMQLSGPNNLANNFFASQINGDNGLLATNGTFGLSNSTPGAVTFSARQGWDITSVDVSGGLTNGITSAYAQNITQGDGYSVNALALQIDVGSPVLTTVQTVDKGSTFVGDILTYTVTVTNSGTADAVNLLFTDPLPFGTSFITNSFTTNGVTIAGANPVNGVPLSSIRQNSALTMTYQVMVNQIPPSAKFITAATINYEYAGTCGNSPIINGTLVNANVQTLVPLLAVNKISSLTNVIPGATFTYTINIPNVGTTNTTGATLLDPLPVGVTYVTNTTTLNGTNVADIGGTNMPYTVAREVHGPGRPAGQINVGDTAVVTFQVTISTNPPLRINNTATIYANGIDPTTAQNAAANISPVYCDLAAGIVGSPNPVAAGAPISYTVSITNNGPNSVNDITNLITLSLPLPSSILSPIYTPSVGSYNPLTGVWSGVTLASNDVITLTISGQLSANVSGTNVAAAVTVTPPPGILDTVTNNNSAATSNAVVQVADLAVTISDGVTNVHQGDALTYTITAINLGPSTLTSLTLSNSFSALLTNLTLFAAQGNFNPANGVWNGLNLTAGNSVTLTVQASVPLNASGALTNTVAISVPAGVTDPVLTNNTASDVDTILLTPDLAIFKSGPATVWAGTNFNYTITITNAGFATASNVVASDVLPTNAVFVSASGGGTNNSGIVNWSVATLAANAKTNFTLTVTAPSSGSLTNLATVTSGTPDANTNNNTSTPVGTTVTPVADLAVGKTAPASVVATSNFTYTVSVTNFGPSSASGVVVTDALPVGVTFVSTTGGGVNSGGSVSWALGTLVSGQVSNVTLTVKAPANGSITNLAKVSSPTLDTNAVNNTSVPVVTATVPLAQSADLSATKTGPSNVFAGTNFNYTISVTNLGPAAASNTVVSDILPTNVVFVSASGGATTNAGTVTWTLGTIGANTATNLTLTVMAPASGTLTNVASVSSPTADPNLTNNVTPPVTTVVTPVADVVLLNVGPTNVLAGAIYTNTISVTNTGPSSATNVVVVDTLPNGVLVTNLAGSLPAGGGTNFTVTYTAPASGSLTNSATSTSGTVDPTPANNTNIVAVTTVTPVADVGLGKIAAATVLASSNLTYTIAVTNFGPSSAGGVVVTDTLPAGVIFVSASGNGVNSSGVVNWSLGTLTSGQISNLTLIVTAPAGGTLTNVASVSSPTSDPNLTNNVTPPVTTSVTPVANLAVGKTGPAGIVFGTNFNYTISVTNFGPSTATGISVTDSLPAGLVFVSSIPVTTTNVSNQVIWTNLGNLAAGATTNLTLTVISTARGTVTNIATAGSPIFEPNPTNNTSAPVVTAITNIPPLANPDSYAVTENTTNTFSPLVNDAVKTPGGSLSLVSVSATNGTASISGTNVIFIPATNFIGVATIGYTITDNVGGTNTGLITVTVTNIPPVANPDSYAVTENTTNTFAVTTNDAVQTPGGHLTVISVSPTNGIATIVNGTNVVFTPTNNFVGITIVGYTVTDNVGGTNSSFITVNVTNIPPLANPDNYAITENTTNTFSPLVNDLVQTPGGSLSLVSVSATNGTASISGTNVIFIPATNFLGTATIGYTITDNVGGTNTSLITVTVTNIPPLANPDSYTVNENTTNTLSPLVNDVLQTPGGHLTLVSVSATNGTASISGTNVIFVAATNFTGVATIGYTITDNVGGTNSSLITITVTNLVPVANPQSVTTTENTATPITLTGSDSGSLPLTYIIVSNPTNGTLTLLNTNTGAVTYTPNTNYVGNDSFTFRVNNGSVSSPPATVSLTVLPVADISVAQSGPASAVAGSNLVYTVSVTNRGPATATSLIISNLLSPGFTFVSASGNGANSNNVVTWNIASLPLNGVTNLTVTIFAAEGGTFTNIASGASAAADLNPTNNNGSLTNAQTRTVITPLADVAVFKDGGTNVFAGASVDYTITATNAGPSTATNVVVQDNLPVGAIFQSASGSYALSNGVVTWPGLTLAPGTATTFTLTLLAPASATSFLNIALATSPVADPNPTNNNGTLSKSRVTTKIAPSADVVVTLVGPPTAIIGSNFVYTIAVTNFGPSTASNVVVSDTLPPGLVFVSASSGGKLTNGIVTPHLPPTNNVVYWPQIPSLALGASTNYTVTVYSLTSGIFTNVASALAVTYDPNPTNNSGVLPDSRVQTSIVPKQFTILAGVPVLNPQTGLFEETATVTNTGNATVLGFRLNVGGLRSGVSLWNADGTNNGVPFINYNFPVDPSTAVSVILEFYDPSRLAFTNTLSAEAIVPVVATLGSTNGSVAVTRVFTDTRIPGDTRFVIEFASVAGKTYVILYSSDLTATNWNIATPSVQASANVTQWYDDGPPKTASKPDSVDARYYRVIQY